MLALFWTTVHSISRQIRMKTQNMIVLTLEFTSTPLSCRGGCLRPDLQRTMHQSYRRLNFCESVRKYTTPCAADTNLCPPGSSSNPNCTLPALKVGVRLRSEARRNPGDHRGRGRGCGTVFPAEGCGGQDFEVRSRDGLQLDAAHPCDAAVDFQDRPEGPVGSR